jgi:hypothetical protein
MEGQGQLAAAVIGHTGMVWTLRTPESKGIGKWGEVKVNISVPVSWNGGGGGQCLTCGEKSCSSPLPCIVGK